MNTRKFLAARMVRVLRQQLLALAPQLTQTRAAVYGRGRFERLELTLCRELTFQLDFFDEEITAFRTLWQVITWGRQPAPARLTPCA
ncbi:MAG: hypothetical protein H7Z21_15625 [Hymenobacter sp.]|nr:hypothetical protein [Hymenobacter sp.]